MGVVARGERNKYQRFWTRLGPFEKGPPGFDLVPPHSESDWRQGEPVLCPICVALITRQLSRPCQFDGGYKREREKETEIGRTGNKNK